MTASLRNASSARPVILDYPSVPPYVGAMLGWLKENEPGFSIRRETSRLRRCSPALVTLVARGQRRLTVDRVDSFAKLLRLTPDERTHLQDWVGLQKRASAPPSPGRSARRRASGQNHLLASWLNPYVKDCCGLPGFQPDVPTVSRLLGGIANPKQIQRSLDYLIAHGFLRRTMDGTWVVNDPLVTTTDEKHDKRIARFHRRSLDIAKRGIGLFPMESRQASAVLVALDARGFDSLKGLLKEFYEKLLQFCEQYENKGDVVRLYQVLTHLTPIGGGN